VIKAAMIATAIVAKMAQPFMLRLLYYYIIPVLDFEVSLKFIE